MAKLTKKELSEHFDDRYTLVAFSNGRRYGFWDNKNILEAIQIQLKCSKMGESCYLFQQDNHLLGSHSTLFHHSLLT